MEHAQRIERTVVADWPADQTSDLDGWLLRASGGPTHRGNSVSTLDAGAMGIDARIAAAEAWYRERRQPIIVQLGPTAQPRGLDAALETRGYRVRGSASALVARAPALLNRARGALDAELAPSPSKEWLEISAHGSRFADTPDSLLGVLERLGSRCVYALAREGGQAVAACLGVRSDQALGVYLMLTVPARRRRGGGSALLRELARAAVAGSQQELYLLVERTNVAACALYQNFGFEHLYDYHYRSREL